MKKTKKVQVAIATPNSSKTEYQFLIFQTNERRGYFWQNVTGKIEKDEEFKDGALRELQEETQIKLENIQKFVDLNLTFNFVDQYGRDVEEKCFLVLVRSKWNPILDPNEHSNYRWIEFKELKPTHLKFAGNYDTILKSHNELKSKNFE